MRPGLIGSGLLHLAALAWLLWPAPPKQPGPAGPVLVSARLVSLPTPAPAPVKPAMPRTLKTAAPPVTRASTPVVAITAAEPSLTVAALQPEAVPPQTATVAPLPVPVIARSEPEYQAALPPDHRCTERHMARHYPPLLRERGIEGQVLLRVRVDEQGQAAEVQVRNGGSGWRLLDEAARALALGCRFVPARRGEQTLASWVEYPVRFALNSR